VVEPLHRRCTTRHSGPVPAWESGRNGLVVLAAEAPAGGDIPPEELPVSIRRPLVALAATFLTAAGVAASAGTATAAPGAAADTSRATYIVTVAPGTPAATALDRSRHLGGEIDHVYTAALNGFAVTLPRTAAAQLSHLPGVLGVELDRPMQIEGSQTGAPWGLDRIDQNLPALDGSYGYTNTGVGVTAYVIDTGVRSTHSEVRGRVRAGYNAVKAGRSTTEDCNGHGTHVAGTIGGTTYGVAKAVTLVPVRVLDCSGNGTTSGVIAGIDWVTANHQTGQPAVANMSLGGGVSPTLDQAVQRSIADGVTYAIAAGNGNTAGVPQDACGSSPARVPAALTVGATDDRDAAAPFSNYGTCVDLFAPGVAIRSAWSTSDTATNTISGTSMATPHVTGVTALYLQTHRAATPADVSAAVLAATTHGVVTSSSTTPNPHSDLLYTDW
jgi:subtilisin family serine protease